MANRGKRVYHGRRASPIVWLIALAVLIAYVATREDLLVFSCVLVVVFLAMTVLSVILYGRKPRP